MHLRALAKNANIAKKKHRKRAAIRKAGDMKKREDRTGISRHKQTWLKP